MNKHRLVTAGVGLAVLSLTVWQLNPSYGKDRTDDSSKDAIKAATKDANSEPDKTGDKEWIRCLSAHLQKRFFALINPTHEQEDQLSTLFGEQYAKNQELRTQLKRKTLAMIDAFSDDNVTNDQLKQQATELRSIHEKLMDSRLEAALKARSVLTSSQKKLLAERVKTRFGGWWQR